MPTLSAGQIGAAFLIQTLIFIFFCRSLNKALLRVKNYNRTIQTGSLWLLLIPGFALFWNFMVVSSMSSSLFKEFTDRDYDIEKQPGYLFGMIYAILSVVYVVLSVVFELTKIQPLFVIAQILNFVALIYFVKYWLRINWFSKVLKNDESDPESTES